MEKMNYAQEVLYLMVLKKPVWEHAYRVNRDCLEDSLGMKCVCGRLATGLHMQVCQKLNKKIIKLTYNELKSLLPK